MKVCTADCTMFGDCPEGWTCWCMPPGCEGGTFCVPATPASLCLSCGTQQDCVFIDCVDAGPLGQVCASHCGNIWDCPTGYECKEATTVDGQAGEYCLPEDSATCTCSPEAMQAGTKTGCTMQNEFGSCPGTAKCLPDGSISECEGPVAAPEACNGLDDDCDGDTDEDYLSFCNEDDDGLAPCVDDDDDNDGVEDKKDNCPCQYNPDQKDLDCDTLGDACDPDDDNDNAKDEDDCAPLNPLIFPGQAEGCDGIDNDCDGDTDEDFPDENLDGIPDCCQPQDDGVDPAKDNCPWMKNPDQKDTDWDGIGDVCDDDDDDDEWSDLQDCLPQNPNSHPGAMEMCDGVDNNCNGKIDEGFPDVNMDGLADCLDIDDDGDGVPDYKDNCPLVPNMLQEDSDGDNIGDACDKDWDNDGKPNLADNCPFAANPDQEDADGNGVGDICEGEDLDGDGTPDGLDCMPKNGKIHPGAEELCDAWDNDCDGENNEGFPHPEAYPVFGNCTTPDEDKDGVGDPWDKCPGLSNPGNADLDKDGLGDACDGDTDGDGALNAEDCEPADAVVFPGAPEKCDNKDNDCDGETDEGAAETDCQDCDPCTWDQCDPAKGCLHGPVDCPEGKACSQWGKCE
ncbi:MAG: hypothetical protein FJ109_08990 [Deltaproteobacteria bacterium]|nr:hypothetical protein [Deltaproteobacteria bacterium]